MQKKFFEILVQTALTVGLFWTILKLIPKSALLSYTVDDTNSIVQNMCSTTTFAYFLILLNCGKFEQDLTKLIRCFLVLLIYPEFW